MIFANAHLLCLRRNLFNLTAISAPQSSKRTTDTLFVGASLLLATYNLAASHTTYTRAPKATCDVSLNNTKVGDPTAVTLDLAQHLISTFGN